MIPSAIMLVLYIVQMVQYLSIPMTYLPPNSLYLTLATLPEASDRVFSTSTFTPTLSPPPIPTATSTTTTTDFSSGSVESVLEDINSVTSGHDAVHTSDSDSGEAVAPVYKAVGEKDLVVWISTEEELVMDWLILWDDLQLVLKDLWRIRTYFSNLVIDYIRDFNSEGSEAVLALMENRHRFLRHLFAHLSSRGHDLFRAMSKLYTWTQEIAAPLIADLISSTSDFITKSIIPPSIKAANFLNRFLKVNVFMWKGFLPTHPASSFVSWQEADALMGRLSVVDDREIQTEFWGEGRSVDSFRRTDAGEWTLIPAEWRRFRLSEWVTVDHVDGGKATMHRGRIPAELFAITGRFLEPGYVYLPLDFQWRTKHLGYLQTCPVIDSADPSPSTTPFIPFLISQLWREFLPSTSVPVPTIDVEAVLLSTNQHWLICTSYLLSSMASLFAIAHILLLVVYLFFKVIPSGRRLVARVFRGIADFVDPGEPIVNLVGNAVEMVIVEEDRVDQFVGENGLNVEFGPANCLHAGLEEDLDVDSSDEDDWVDEEDSVQDEAADEKSGYERKLVKIEDGPVLDQNRALEQEHRSPPTVIQETVHDEASGSESDELKNVEVGSDSAFLGHLVEVLVKLAFGCGYLCLWFTAEGIRFLFSWVVSSSADILFAKAIDCFNLFGSLFAMITSVIHYNVGIHGVFDGIWEFLRPLMIKFVCTFGVISGLAILLGVFSLKPSGEAVRIDAVGLLKSEGSSRIQGEKARQSVSATDEMVKPAPIIASSETVIPVETRVVPSSTERVIMPIGNGAHADSIGSIVECFFMPTINRTILQRVFGKIRPYLVKMPKLATSDSMELEGQGYLSDEVLDFAETVFSPLVKPDSTSVFRIPTCLMSLMTESEGHAAVETFAENLLINGVHSFLIFPLCIRQHWMAAMIDIRRLIAGDSVYAVVYDSLGAYVTPTELDRVLGQVGAAVLRKLERPDMKINKGGWIKGHGLHQSDNDCALFAALHIAYLGAQGSEVWEFAARESVHPNLLTWQSSDLRGVVRTAEFIRSFCH